MPHCPKHSQDPADFGQDQCQLWRPESAQEPRALARPHAARPQQAHPYDRPRHEAARH